MKTYTLFKEYIWLVNTIHSARKISLEEINERWKDTEMSEGIGISRSTFNRHKSAIEDMFGIYIECDKKDSFKYFIGNQEVLDEDSIQNWMLSTLSVNNVLSESKSVSDRIVLESIPSTGDNLHRFIEAMKMSVRIQVIYRRYGTTSESSFTIEPYMVKLFNKRWYALVKFADSQGFFILSFDRILQLSLTNEHFEYNKEFDASAYFSECYGILRDVNIAVDKVVVRAFGREVFYLRDLPLHHSQKEIDTTDEYADFELKLRPTGDFFSQLLSRGSAIKVIEPQWVADEIKKLHQESAALYL